MARKNKDFTPLNCPVTVCMNKIGGRWKPVVVYLITEGKNRFSLLQKAMPDISKQMLVNQLRELEHDQIIKRTIYAEMPPRVEYVVSEYGKTILPIISLMADWGKEDIKRAPTGEMAL